MGQRLRYELVAVGLTAGVLAALAAAPAADAPGPAAPAPAPAPVPLPPPIPTELPPPAPTTPSPLAPAADPPGVPWGKGTYRHVAVDQKLADVLREFASDQGLNVVISPEAGRADVRISASFPAQPPESFLNTVTRDNGLIWYYDGTSLYVYRNDELKSKFFTLGKVEPDSVTAALRSMGIPLARTAIRPLPREGLIYVVGTPRLMELVDDVLKSLQGNTPGAPASPAGAAAPATATAGSDAPSRPLQTVLLHLNYVRAVDVAAVIKPLLSKDGVVTVTPPAQEGLFLFGYGGLTSQFGNPYLGGTAGGMMGGMGGGMGGMGGGMGGMGGGIPSFGLGGSGGGGGGGGSNGMAAYSSPNSITGGNSLSGLDAIIIKDYAENLVAVVDAVRRLDCQPLQILIEAVILRVELTDDQKLGVDIANVTNRANAAIVSGDALALNTAAGISARVLGAAAPYSPGPSGYSYLNSRQGQLVGGFLPTDPSDIGLKYGYSSHNVTAFVEALESLNKVDVMASPRMLVLNKQLAQIQLGNRLGYQQSVTNFPTTYNYVQFLNTGTLLLLRPYVTTDGMVRMEIHPERSEGVINNKGLPESNVSELTTNVIVPDGSTIAIGGLMVNEDTITEAGVLGLSRLPVVGPLFRNRGTSAVKRELVILLTPRIVRQGGLPPAVPGALPQNASGVPGSGPMPGPPELPPLPGDLGTAPVYYPATAAPAPAPNAPVGPGGNIGIIGPGLGRPIGTLPPPVPPPPLPAGLGGPSAGVRRPAAGARPGVAVRPPESRGYRPGSMFRAAANAVAQPFGRRPPRDPDVRAASGPNP